MTVKEKLRLMQEIKATNDRAWAAMANKKTLQDKPQVK